MSSNNLNLLTCSTCPPAHLGGDETPSQEPRGLKTRLSKRTRSRTRRRARGKGSRRWWNWAKSGLPSKSDQVMFGGSHIEGDQKVAARDAIVYLAPAISTLLHPFSGMTGYSDKLIPPRVKRQFRDHLNGSETNYILHSDGAFLSVARLEKESTRKYIVET